MTATACPTPRICPHGAHNAIRPNTRTHSWGPNTERGVFKTSNAGETWEKVLYLDQTTGCSDLDIEWDNPRVLYAGMWTFARKPWRFDDGGGETALYRTIDAGKTWQKLSKGLPKGDLARIGVSIAQSSPNIVSSVSKNHGFSGRYNRKPQVSLRLGFSDSDFSARPECRLLRGECALQKS